MLYHGKTVLCSSNELREKKKTTLKVFKLFLTVVTFKFDIMK